MPGRIERLATAIRHSAPLERASPLWNFVRPAYDTFLRRAFERQGLARSINGEPFRIDPTCRTVREDHEPIVWRELVGNARQGDHAVDVGGHLGVYSVALARRVRPSGTVDVFEPDEANSLLLRRHLELNGVANHVNHHLVALGRDPGFVRFAGGVSQLSHVDAHGEREVMMSTLDKEFPAVRVDLLKIDVEGHELEVLAGGATLLADRARRPRLIALEVHRMQLERIKQTPDNVRELLSGYGYHVRELVVDPLTSAWIAQPAPR